MSDAPAAAATENGVASVEKVEEIGFKVFAGNLAYTTTDEGLRAFFAPVEADIISAQVIQRGTRSAGYGFVALKTAEAAQKAVELLDKKQLESREVIVEVAKPSEQKDKEKKEKKAKRRPGRRGAKAVPGEVTDAEANGEAKADASGAEKPKKKKKVRTPKPKKEGEAAATDAPADGAAAPEKREKKPRKPKTPKVPRAPGEDPVGEPSKTMCFVANLGFTTDDAGLEAIFTEAGLKVTSARVVRRRWGQPRKSKGFGFVELADEEEQKKAVAALDNKEIGGRVLTVRVAVNTPRDESADAKEPEAVVVAS